MSVEPSESMSEDWSRWQGQVINATFPLGRLLGVSDHSGVFLTRSAGPGAADVAIKLVPTNRALAESLLPRWKRAGALAHPHLLPLLQWGGCQLEGLPYLYALMEYADQTLAQLLQHRALTDEEAREMLQPVLEALAFLHGQDLVHGQLKPANILVVGDQLKLASDTVRRRVEAAPGTHALTAYDPPEARQGTTSPAGDIWALGVTLYEALTGRVLPESRESDEAPLLPPDFSPVFRDLVARCLSPRVQDRPGVAELAAFAAGHPAAPASPEPPIPELKTPDPAPPAAAKPEVMMLDAPRMPPVPVAPEVAPADAPPPPPESHMRERVWLAVLLGALVVLALVWGAVRMFGTHRAPGPPPPPARVSGAPVKAESGATAAAGSAGQAARKETGASSASGAVHEVIPDVPVAARRTIRGHIKVWVRVIVNQDGSVFAAVPDKAGPSRYFERLAIEAAQQWTFPPADTSSQRFMQLRFDFSRDGTTGRVVRLK